MYYGSSGYEPGHNLIPRHDSYAQYYEADGTSASSAFVSGLAALIWSRYPDLTNDQVMNLMRFSAEDLGQIGIDVNYGYGLLNAYDALMLRLDDTFDLMEYEDPLTDNSQSTFAITPGDVHSYNGVIGAVSLGGAERQADGVYGRHEHPR